MTCKGSPHGMHFLWLFDSGERLIGPLSTDRSLDLPIRINTMRSTDQVREWKRREVNEMEEERMNRRANDQYERGESV